MAQNAIRSESGLTPHFVDDDKGNRCALANKKAPGK